MDPDEGSVGFQASGWGWPEGESHLEVIASDPAVVEGEPDSPTLSLESPGDWRGPVRFSYRLKVLMRGTELSRRYGLLPNRGGGYSFGSSLNALLRPTLAGDEFDCEVTIELVAAQPDGCIVTGWAGRAKGSQRASPDVPWGNSYIAFGELSAVAMARAGELQVEVFQLGRAYDTAEHAAERLCVLAPTIARHLDWPARNPSRVFLSNAMSGSMGTNYGFRVNVPTDAREGQVGARRALPGEEQNQASNRVDEQGVAEEQEHSVQQAHHAEQSEASQIHPLELPTGCFSALHLQDQSHAEQRRK